MFIKNVLSLQIWSVRIVSQLKYNYKNEQSVFTNHYEIWQKHYKTKQFSIYNKKY